MRKTNDHLGFASGTPSADHLSSDEIHAARKLLIAKQHGERASNDLRLTEAPPHPFATPALAQHVLEWRRARTAIFGGGLFSDPAWDILLDMFIRSELNELVTIAGACSAANVPESTGLRYVKLLGEKGYIERSAHPHDRRSVNIKMTSSGVERMNGWLTRFLHALNQ